MLVHDIDISKYSLLSKILGEKLRVNSIIHRYAINKYDILFKIAVTYNDIIEATEYNRRTMPSRTYE